MRTRQVGGNDDTTQHISLAPYKGTHATLPQPSRTSTSTDTVGKYQKCPAEPARVGTQHWAPGGWTGDWRLGTGDRKLENKIQATVDRPLRIYPPASHLPRMKAPGRVHLVGALPVSLAPVLAACATILAVHYPKNSPFPGSGSAASVNLAAPYPRVRPIVRPACGQRGHCGRCQTARLPARQT